MICQFYNKFSNKLLFITQYVIVKIGISLLVFAIACQKHRPQSTAEQPIITASYEDTIVKTDSQRRVIKNSQVADSTMQYILANPTGTISPPLAEELTQQTGNYELSYEVYHLNLDDSPEKEVVLYADFINRDTIVDYKYITKELFIWHKKGNNWKRITSEKFHNSRGMHLVIDTLNKIVVTKQIVGGSGYYGLETTLSKVSQDTLISLFSYMEEEWNSDITFRFNYKVLASHGIKGQYKQLNSKLFRVDYKYQFDLDDEDKKLVLLATHFSVKYQWSEKGKEFILKPNQRIGNYKLQDGVDKHIAINIDDFVKIYTDTLKSLARKGNKHQKYYLKNFDYTKQL